MNLVEKFWGTLIVLLYLALYFCGLDFGLYNFKLMTTANGINAVAHFFIGTISVVIFLLFTRLNISALIDIYKKYIKHENDKK